MWVNRPKLCGYLGGKKVFLQAFKWLYKALKTNGR